MGPHADGKALPDPRISAGRVMTDFIYTYMVNIFTHV